MTAKTFTTTLRSDDAAMCAIEVPFDPKEIFGKVRAPVTVSINSHTYRSTICKMGGACWIPVRKSNQAAAGVKGGDRVKVTVALDETPRVVKPPKELAAALKADPTASAAWKKLSYTHQREHAEAIEDAKRPETRDRRVAKALEMLRAGKKA